MTSSRWRLSDARFLLILLLPATTLLNVLLRPQTAFWGAIAILLLVAAVDACWPGAQRSPAPAGPQPQLRWLLRLYVPLQAALLLAGLARAPHLDWLQVAGLAFGVGFVTGSMGITFAHELGHSRHRADRVLAWLLMASVNYSHFMVEHYRGHHPRAASRDDPASARRGESLWRFLPRTLAGSCVDAWRLERQMLLRTRRGWTSSALAWSWGANLAIVGALAAAGQGRMLAFWLGQSAIAIWLLETVNYIEHYGLQRNVDATGRREPFGVQHAWNADHVLSNSVLANLQRHSDHHLRALTPFPQLQALPGPQLPTGYAGCIWLAAVPPLWFALMDPKVEAVAGTESAERAAG
ncbi:alkane 1-monooxygenase [Caenimonas terrae]|uniref:Alkane 1-monooxygenase n=1 Tax=Caenimonas terrae TaxID=696074 RepID=A0ABW0NHQ1_9BURK